MQPWAAKRCDAIGCGKGQLGRAVDDSMDPYITSCAPFGIPRLMNHVGPFEILQTPGRVLMMFETGNSQRQIWTDGRGHPADLDSTWMGNSIGHWEADTLVVDTIGLNDKTWLDYSGLPHGEKLKVQERYTLTDPNTIKGSLTLTDPDYYTASWTTNFTLKKQSGMQIEENVCTDTHRM